MNRECNITKECYWRGVGDTAPLSYPRMVALSLTLCWSAASLSDTPKARITSNGTKARGGCACRSVRTRLTLAPDASAQKQNSTR
jgi:hypothetical protein